MKEYYTKDDGTYPKEYCIPAEILAQRCLLPVTNCLEEDKYRFYLCFAKTVCQKNLKADSDSPGVCIDQREGGDVGHCQRLSRRVTDVDVHEKVNNCARAKVDLKKLII